MRIEIPQIFWHGNRDRIMSIDFYPNSNIIVTCGAEEDKMWIKLWEIEEVGASTDHSDNPFKTNKPNAFLNGINCDKVDLGNSNCMQSIICDENPFNSFQNTNRIKPKFLYEISGAHTATVNIVRFSPNGMYLASGGDDSAIVIWAQKSRPVEFGSSLEKICWSNYKILRGHLSDIYDLSWSPDSKYLISGSVDNSAIIFSLEKAKGIQRMNDHNSFVQGVCWDPKNKYVITQSSDRSAIIYKNTKDKRDLKFFKFHKLKKSSSINNEANDNNIEFNENSNLLIKEKNKSNNFCFFGDQIQCPSFVRRLSWSPDGSFCLLVGENNEIENVVWGLHRKSMKKPAFMLPTLDKSAVCIRFCPIIFKKDQKDDSIEELINLDYKIIFAIGTIDSIYIYDTQSVIPRTIHTNIHYLQINDLTWQGDKMLAACSSDGYITFIIFEKNELGNPISPEGLIENVRNYILQHNSIDITKSILNNITIIKNVKKKEEPYSNSMNLIVEDEKLNQSVIFEDDKINQNSSSNYFNLHNININFNKIDKKLDNHIESGGGNDNLNPSINILNITKSNTANEIKTSNNLQSVQNNSNTPTTLNKQKKITPTLINKYD